METAQPKLRKYQPVWQKLIAHPEKTVKVAVSSTAMMHRVKKAVWKEKDLDRTKNDRGFLIKELWRLTVEIDEKHLHLLFKLVPTNHPGNI